MSHGPMELHRSYRWTLGMLHRVERRSYNTTTCNNPKSKIVAARVRIMGWDFSNSYFPSDLAQAPRPAGRAGYMISITDFVKDTDETGAFDFDFKIEKMDFLRFQSCEV